MASASCHARQVLVHAQGSGLAPGGGQGGDEAGVGPLVQWLAGGERLQLLDHLAGAASFGGRAVGVAGQLAASRSPGW